MTLAAALVACGGGTDGAAAPPPPPPPPPPASQGSALGGRLYGIVDTQVVLQNNGGDDLALTVPRQGTDRYIASLFEFATKLLDGADYQVSVKTAPAGQTCSVYKGASGKMPVDAQTLRVGCESTYNLVSRSFDEKVFGTYFNSSAPAIGGIAAGATSLNVGLAGEGRYTVFVSNAANLETAVTGARRQIYWHDSHTGTTRLVSVSGAGAEGNGDSFAPQISADGQTVVFESYANNLVTGDSNGVRDVFVWTNTGLYGTMKRASVGAGGVEGNSDSYEPVLSADGSVVAFSSGASNLTPGVSGISTINVYRRDLVAGTNTLLTAHQSKGVGVGGSKPAISEDGSRVAFYSFSSNIVPGDVNGLWDIFVYDAANGTRKRVSLPNGGGERNQGSESASREVAPAISGNGRYVAFATTATNMVAGDTNGAQDVFVVDTQTGSVVRASVDGAGVQGNADSPSGQGERPSLSYDGNWVAFRG